jgi:hypothetical protein
MTMETNSFLSITYGPNCLMLFWDTLLFLGITIHFLGIVKWMMNMPTKSHITYKDLQNDMVWTLIKYLIHG